MHNSRLFFLLSSTLCIRYWLLKRKMNRFVMESARRSRRHNGAKRVYESHADWLPNWWSANFNLVARLIMNPAVLHLCSVWNNSYYTNDQNDSNQWKANWVNFAGILLSESWVNTWGLGKTWYFLLAQQFYTTDLFHKISVPQLFKSEDKTKLVYDH